MTLTCWLTCCPLTPPASSSWNLTISASCYSTALVIPTVNANYNLYLNDTAVAATIIKWQDTFSITNGTDGTGSDLCAARNCVSNSSYAVWNATSQNITVKVPTGSTATGVFPVTITCSLSGYPSVPSQTLNFTVTVSSPPVGPPPAVVPPPVVVIPPVVDIPAEVPVVVIEKIEKILASGFYVPNIDPPKI